MTSGPWPILADTADLGRRSSHDTESTLTSTPVSWVNFLLFSSHSVSSPWTNFDGRRMRRLAPFSGAKVQLGAPCAAAGRDASLSPSAAPAAAAPVSFSKSRRVTSAMTVVSSCLRRSRLAAMVRGAAAPSNVAPRRRVMIPSGSGLASPGRGRLDLAFMRGRPIGPIRKRQEEHDMATELQHWIGGRRVGGASGQFGDVYNPASGEVTARGAVRQRRRGSARRSRPRPRPSPAGRRRRRCAAPA